jgi:hypothetical protein
MTLDPSELLKKATEFMQEAGRVAAEAMKKAEASGRDADLAAKKAAAASDHAAPAKKAALQQEAKKRAEAEAERADREEEAADRAREQGALNAKTARVEAEIRAREARSEAREQAKDVREQGEDVAKGLVEAAQAMRGSGITSGAAEPLERQAKAVREAAEAKAKDIEKAGEAASNRELRDGEIAAKAALKAADEVAQDHEGAAEDARDAAAAARESARMNVERPPQKRAEADSDHADVPAKKQAVQDRPTDNSTAEDGPATAPSGSGASQSAAPQDLSTAELKEMADKYSSAAEALHKRRLDHERNIDPEDHRHETSSKMAGVDAQLKQELKYRDAIKSERLSELKKAESLEREAQRLEGKKGQEGLAQEKHEAAQVAAARAERMIAEQKNADAQVAKLQEQQKALQKDWERELDEHLGKGGELEKTADQMDDAAKAMSEAYRARQKADEAAAEAKKAFDESGQEDLQLRLKAETAAAEASQALAKAQNMTPQDAAGRKALEDAGVPASAQPTTPAAPTMPATPVTVGGAGDADGAPADLHARVVAQTSEAEAARSRLVDALRKSEADDVTQENERLLIEKAQIQEASELVEMRRTLVAEAQAKVAEQQAELQTAVANKDPGATELRERLEANAALLQGRQDSLAAAETRVAGLKPRADQIDKRLAENTSSMAERTKRWDAAEAELDRFEEQTTLLAKAEAKFAEAARTHDPQALAEAKAALGQAQATKVDHAVIRNEVPDFSAGDGPSAPSPVGPPKAGDTGAPEIPTPETKTVSEVTPGIPSAPDGLSAHGSNDAEDDLVGNIETPSGAGADRDFTGIATSERALSGGQELHGDPWATQQDQSPTIPADSRFATVVRESHDGMDGQISLAPDPAAGEAVGQDQSFAEQPTVALVDPENEDGLDEQSHDGSGWVG